MLYQLRVTDQIVDIVRIMKQHLQALHPDTGCIVDMAIIIQCM